MIQEVVSSWQRARGILRGVRERVRITTAGTSDGVADRIAFFRGRPGNRYWWHRQVGDSYLPEVYAILSREEWRVLRAWYEETDARSLPGECAVPLISWLSSFVSANNVSRIVQLGTHVGYSTLLLGWTLRRMGKAMSLLAVDIEASACEFTRRWVQYAGLTRQVAVHCGDSAASDLPARASEILGGPPQLVFIDSSHQYEHTIRELDLWYPAVANGALIVMHDTSEFAVQYDTTGKGGVARALAEWTTKISAPSFNLAYPRAQVDKGGRVYLDGCGAGIILKTT